MEVEHASPVSRNDDADQTGDNDRGNWHRRLRLRKSSASSVTLKSVTEEEKVVTEALEEVPKESLPTKDLPHQSTVNSSTGKLTFTCSNCKDGTAFSPQGLLDHFTVFHGGKGDPPTFPCDMCKFATPEFTVLQQHRLKHRQCRLTCEICNDNVLQTLSQLKKHCKNQHRLDGQYHCDKCKFSTKELKIFVYHSCPVRTESQVDSTENKSVCKHVNGELNRNHVAVADWGPQKEELLKHKAAECCQGWRRKTWRKERKKEVSSEHQSVSMPDLLSKPPETQWTTSGFLHFSAAGLLGENGVLLDPAKTLEETQQFLERTVNSGKKWAVPFKGGPELAPQSCTLGPVPSQPKTIATKQYNTPVPGLKNYVSNKLSGLLEKNNISVPPDCTTKVVGFKMVDEKKHLVLKVIPSAKPDICPDSGEVSPGLNPAEFNGIESDSQVERPSDETCAELPNATSSSEQSEKVSGNQLMNIGSREDSPQGDNTENDCNNGFIKDSSALTEASNEPPKLTVSGTKEDFNLANQNNTEQLMMSPDVFSDSNGTHQLKSVSADVAMEVSSLREVDLQTLNTNIHNVEHKKMTLIDTQEKALDDLKENRPELTKSHNDSGSPEDFDGFISLKESQLSALNSEEDRSPRVNFNNIDKENLEEEAQVTLSSLLHLNEQNIRKMQSNARASASPCSSENQAIFELNNSNPAFVSLHKHTTEPLFNSQSEDVGLLFQDSGDEYTNSVDSRDAPVPLDQICTSETVEETNYLAASFLGDSCHNPDLYQTLEELPVTTVNHLLDDPEVTSRGITNQTEGLGSRCTQQAGLQSSPKAIPVAAKDSTQTNVCLLPANEPAMKRRREEEQGTKDSQQYTPKARKQMVRKSQVENDPPASIPYWEPVPQTVERTLKLQPVYSSQPIKVPRLNQPVIVLNHPDTDIPEVANIMRVVNKHRGAVQKVLLSQGTLQALSELNCDTFRKSLGADCHSSHCRRVWPQGTARERFILKLRLKRLCGHKYKVTPSASKANGYQSTFRCWFCGRLFRNQEAWVGHGQRHLMEATRDWNKLFSCNGQHNSPIEPYFH